MTIINGELVFTSSVFYWALVAISLVGVAWGTYLMIYPPSFQDPYDRG